MQARIFPAAPAARYFSLALLCEIAYEFGLCDAFNANTNTLALFQPDTTAHAAYWNGHHTGISLLYQLTGQRLFTCAYDSLEEVTYYD